MICNKMPFLSKEAAVKESKQIPINIKFAKHKMHGNDNKKLKPYLCPKCKLWHLTSQPKLKHRKK